MFVLVGFGFFKTKIILNLCKTSFIELEKNPEIEIKNFDLRRVQQECCTETKQLV